MIGDSELPIYSIETLRATHSGDEVRDVEVFRFEYFARDIEHLKAPHRHHFYTFLLVTAGGGSHNIDFNNYSLQPNRLFLIAPGQVHAWNDLNNVAGFVVMFTDSFVALSKGRKIMSAWPLFRIGQSCYIDLTPPESAMWEEECLFMEAEVKKPDDFSRDAIFYSIGTLLVRASRLFTQRTKSEAPDLLFAFQELIELHFMEKRTPKEYAALMNITPNHLNTLVKKKSGKSAGELIRQRVILEAKRLLAHTQLSVAETAYQLGFSDNSYFGRFFKKYTGATPESFRRKQQS